MSNQPRTHERRSHLVEDGLGDLGGLRKRLEVIETKTRNVINQNLKESMLIDIEEAQQEAKRVQEILRQLF